MVLEVMGRDAGHIALSAGIAGGADVIVIPEVPYKVEHIAAKIDRLKMRGRNFALVIVAESVKMENGDPVKVVHRGGETRYGGIGHYLADKISDATSAETRVTVLGHVQRGAAPSAQDRLFALTFGAAAVDLIAAGRYDRLVGSSGSLTSLYSASATGSSLGAIAQPTSTPAKRMVTQTLRINLAGGLSVSMSFGAHSHGCRPAPAVKLTTIAFAC